MHQISIVNGYPDVFLCLETPKSKVSRKGKKHVRLVHALNPVTCYIQVQMSLLKDMLVLSVKKPSKLEDGNEFNAY